MRTGRRLVQSPLYNTLKVLASVYHTWTLSEMTEGHGTRAAYQRVMQCTIAKICVSPRCVSASKPVLEVGRKHAKCGTPPRHP